MIDFTTLQGLTIPEGVVTQITDENGRVIWMVQSGGKPIVLEVEKITSDTYAAETTYTAEEFILLDIYPKTNGTVKVTYGSVTKTITDTSGVAEPNAQKVFFGTFNGVSDEIATPASGTLTIEGSYRGFAISTFTESKSTLGYCSCITTVTSFGNPTRIPDYAFYKCKKLNISSILPEGITYIGNNAFGVNSSNDVMSNTKITFPTTLETIYENAFTYKLSAASTDEYYGYLTEMIMLSEIPPTLVTETNVWLAKQSVAIVVPDNCLEVYKGTDGWSEYKHALVNKGYISFTILSNTFFAANETMTWSEWVASDYNNKYVVEGNYIVYITADYKSYIIDSNNNRVLASDIIQKGYAYKTEVL